MFPRLLRPPPTSFFLLGARGTGKTTWVRAHLPEARRFDLLEEDRFHRYLADPGAFAREVSTVDPGEWVVIDEVQRLPALLNEVHRQIEARSLKFALTGSSARKLRRAGVNLLAGRAVHRTMFPLSPAELGGAWDLDRALRHGTLPLVWTAPDPEDTLRAYAMFYLQEEIRAEAQLRNLAGFARFLPIAALFHGQVLNVSSLARDAGVSRTTVAGYLEVLEDTLLATRLPGFEPRLRVRERSHPKLYFVDPGIARVAARGSGDPGPRERGPLFEGLVHTLIRQHRDLGNLHADEVAYWTPTAARDTEVDFVVTRGREHVAIEVKSAATAREDHLRGLRAIGELSGLVRRIAVYPAVEPARTHDGIEIVGVRGFEDQLAAGLFA